MIDAKDHPYFAISPTDLEQSIGHESVEKNAAAPINSLVDIHIHSARNRLADSDGICAKQTIDGLVHAGILRNDSPKEVRQTSYTQEKVKGQEYTEVTISILDITKRTL
jgi:hypothetical protein